MQLAILTLSRNSFNPDLAPAIQLAGMEVLDYLPDAPLEGLNQAAAFVLSADRIDFEAEAVAQSLINYLQEQAALGKAILGLGAGAASLLANAGLVPGLYKHWAGLRVSASKVAKEQRAWMRLSEDYQLNSFTQGLSSRAILPLRMPVEAQFHIPPGLMLELRSQGQLVFSFCEETGRLLPGSAIAAVSDKAGRVLALLAQPEAAALEPLFKALQVSLSSPYREAVEPLYYWPRKGLE